MGKAAPPAKQQNQHLQGLVRQAAAVHCWHQLGGTQQRLHARCVCCVGVVQKLLQ